MEEILRCVQDDKLGQDDKNVQNGKLFGTDGIRGTANHFPLDVGTLVRVGQQMTDYLKKKTFPTSPMHFFMAKDTRLSGDMIESALTAGILSRGGGVEHLGILPTAALAFMTKKHQATAGIMISASHNPFQDNGIKLFLANGFKFTDQEEAEFELLFRAFRQSEHASNSCHSEANRPKNLITDVGCYSFRSDGIEEYLSFLKSKLGHKNNLHGMKIIVDCANGAAFSLAPRLYESLGADVMALSATPTGMNINDKCGALYPDLLRTKVLEEHADLGIALDGDADRLILVDDQGHVLDGDYIMAIIGSDLLAERRLVKDTLVCTVMSNMGLEATLKRRGGKIHRTQVGDRYVVDAMRKEGYNFGGETCGHLVFFDDLTTGDGLLSSIHFLNVMLKKESRASDLCRILDKFPQILVNLDVRHKRPLEELQSWHDVEKINKILGDSGRIFIRYSGTENCLRIMLEGEDLKTIERYGEELKCAFQRELA